MIGDKGKALTLFRSGLNTVEISRRLNVTEAVALKWVSEQRSATLGLPRPYEAPDQAQSNLYPIPQSSGISGQLMRRI